MHNTIAFMQEPGTTTEEPIAGVSDDTMRVNGDDIIIAELNQIVALFGGGHSTQTLRVKTPSLAEFMLPYIHPYQSFAGGATWIVGPVPMAQNPIPVKTNEAMNALAKVSEVHTGHDNYVGVSLSNGPIAPVFGDIRTMVIEADFSSTQKTWMATDLTLPVDLPVGRYQIVGAMCRGAYPGIFRLIPVGGGPRPGGMMDAGDYLMDCRPQRWGAMGIWMEFDQLAPPRLEICSSVTGSWYSLKLDLLKV